MHWTKWGKKRITSWMFQHCLNDLEVSTSFVKETFISCSCRAGISKNQTQGLILQVAELQHKLNSQRCSLSTVRVRALTGKEWGPENCKIDICEEPNEAGSLNPQIWQFGSVFSPDIKLALPGGKTKKQTSWESPEVVAWFFSGPTLIFFLLHMNFWGEPWNPQIVL